MMSKKTFREFRVGGKTYAVVVSTAVHELWLSRFRELDAAAEESGNWAEANAAREKFLRAYAVVKTGYHLPPGRRLPRGMCFGPKQRLEHLPVEPKRPPGSCWDDP